jgi:hypothetical protein
VAEQPGYAFTESLLEFDKKRCKWLIFLESFQEFPLQEVQLGVRSGVLDSHGGQQIGVVAVDGGDACDRHAPVQLDALPLDAPQLG